MVSLNDVDLRILQILQSNSRISFSELGRSLGLSATAARNRINALINRGIITKFGAVYNWAKIGWQIQVLMLIRTEHGKTEAVIKHLHRIPHVLTITKTAGSFDLAIRLMASDINDFANVLQKRLARIPGITRMNSLIVLDEVNNTPSLLPDSKLL